MKIEANLLPKREPIEANQVVDWFSTLKETETTMKRLYNPRLRNLESQKVWNELPKFLEKNKDLLNSCMESKYVSVHLHGSMLLGVGNDGNGKIEKSQEIRPSDIDLMIFTDKKDQSKRNDYSKGLLFIEKSNFQKKFNRNGHILITNISELKEQIKEVSEGLFVSLLSGQKLVDNKPIYKIAVLFGSGSLFQNNPEQEAKWRNEILKIILENKNGRKLWDEGVRECFNRYIAGYEENSWISLESVRQKHKIRVGMTFDEILDKKMVKEAHRQSAREALSKQRQNIKLPQFDTIKNFER